ncbi:MAG: bifunctional riboflavin kinase/FAD synthetase [Tissierellia bacterium]|nr:bifunctional riboflavin kinase/FAD synthetase [Tissierellia bacterium]
MIKVIDLDKGMDKYPASVVGLGNFDGIHIGHREIMKKVIEVAKDKNMVSSVLLFKQHTNEVFPKMPRFYLSDIKDKIDILEKLGIEQVFIIDFTMEFAQLTNEEFILDFIRDKLNGQILVCGVDYTYGRFAKGTVKELYEFQEQKSIKVEVVEPRFYKNHKASSTTVRGLIREGNVEEAQKLLVDFYSVRGVVEHGFKRGSKQLGFPTANLKFNFNYIIPAEAVYLTRNTIDGKTYYSLTSIGTNPTFTDDKALKFEVFIIDYEGDLYGSEVKVEFLKKVRDQIKFTCSDDLIDQMNKDLEFAREFIKTL